MKIGRMLRALLSGGLKGHFGQHAEDVVVRKFFPRDMRDGTYLDLGAFHPFKFSNTAFAWLNGWKGVNVDANPGTIELFRKYRKTDTNIWAAVVTDAQIRQGLTSIELHVPQAKSGRIRASAIGSLDAAKTGKGEELAKISVPAKSINQIIRECGLSHVDLLNIDIEGYDERVIRDLDFSLCSPTMIVIEDFCDSFESLLRSGITTFLNEKGYELVGRVKYSSIFRLRTTGSHPSN